MSSLEVLNLIDQKTEFMDSLRIVADMGCGRGADSYWWSTRTSPEGKDRNLIVFAVDQMMQLDNHYRHKNIKFIRESFTSTTIAKNKVDVLWCYNAFQYATDPVKTLRHWWDIMSPDGLLYIGIPQNNYIDDLSRWQMITESGCYWPHNITSLIYLLAANGFDCNDGFFRQQRHDKMIHLCAYKSPYAPMTLDQANLYQLDEMKLLPPSISNCVKKFGAIRHEHLHLRWLDGNVYDLAIESMP